MRSSGIHPRATSQEMLKICVLHRSFKVGNSMLQPHPQRGANELIRTRYCGHLRLIYTTDVDHFYNKYARVTYTYMYCIYLNVCIANYYPVIIPLHLMVLLLYCLASKTYQQS